MLSILYDTNQNGELATYELESNFEKDSRKLGYYRWWASISYVEMPREQSKETFDRMWTALGEPESEWARLMSEAADHACRYGTGPRIENHSTGHVEDMPEYYPGIEVKSEPVL